MTGTRGSSRISTRIRHNGFGLRRHARIGRPARFPVQHPHSIDRTMNTMERAITLEFLKIFGMALVVISLFMLFYYVADELRACCLGPRQSLALIPYLLPHVIRLASQGAGLFAACFIYGRMSANNELVALSKPLVFGPCAVLIPTLVLGLVFSLTAVWLYNIGEGWGRAGIYQVCVRNADEIVCEMLRRERIRQFGKVTIAARDVSDGQLGRLLIWVDEERKSAPLCVAAESGSVRLASNRLFVTLCNAIVEMEDRVKYVCPDEMAFELETPVLDDDRHVTLETVARQQRTVSDLAKQLKQVSIPGREDPVRAPKLTAQVTAARTKLRMMETRFHHKWANSFCCLAFISMGAPLAIRLRTADYLSTFFLCFLPFLLVYSPSMAFIKSLACAGAVPPQAVWLCNAVVGSIGAWLTCSVVRH